MKRLFPILDLNYPYHKLVEMGYALANSYIFLVRSKPVAVAMNTKEAVNRHIHHTLKLKT